VTLTEIGTVVRFIAGGGETATIMDHGGPLIDGEDLSLSFGNTLAKQNSICPGALNARLGFFRQAPKT